MGTLAIWSYDNEPYEYLWIKGTKKELKQKLYKKNNNSKKIIIHTIIEMSFDSFISYLELKKNNIIKAS